MDEATFIAVAKKASQIKWQLHCKLFFFWIFKRSNWQLIQVLRILNVNCLNRSVTMNEKKCNSTHEFFIVATRSDLLNKSAKKTKCYTQCWRGNKQYNKRKLILMIYWAFCVAPQAVFITIFFFCVLFFHFFSIYNWVQLHFCGTFNMINT